MNVNIKLTGTDELDRVLDQIAKRVKNMKPALSEAGNYLENIMEESFENESSPDGKNWLPLAASTLIQKNKKGSKNILYDDGTLSETIAHEATSKDLIVGVNAYSNKGYPYPVVHQFGSKDGKTPARQFMPVNSEGELYSEVKEELVDLLTDFLKASLK